MLQLSENKFIDVGFVEMLWSESSVFFAKMTSGDVHVISPFQFKTIMDLKKLSRDEYPQEYVG